MTLQQSDQLIAAWQQRLSAAAQNLMDLHAQPTYQRLAGADRVPKADLGGITEARVRPALAAMGTLFQNFDLLQQNVDKAARIRKDMPSFFGGDAELREIERLLCGKSIKLPSVSVPLEQRDLLSALENVEWITPNDLMNAMARSFGAARDVVLAVHMAWEKLGRMLDATEQEVKSLEQLAARLAVAQSPELDRARLMLVKLRSKIESDPLGCSDQLDQDVQPVVARLKSELDLTAGAKQDAENGLASARLLLDRLKSAHQLAIAAVEEFQQKISECGSPRAPMPEEKIAALEEWLERLRAKLGEGLAKPVLVGLRNWNNAARKCVAEEEGACAANRAPLEARSELRGRLDALKAKARGYGLAEDPALVEIAEQAAALLYARPTPLDRAAALVKSYESKLNGRTAQARS